METNYYNKLVDKEVTKFYKITDNEIEININKETKKIATKLKLDNRIKQLVKVQPFINLKNHKENFTTKPHANY